YLDSGIHSGA
nr:Chain C, peptide 30-39 from beta-Catenin: YLDSGIHSGA [synthetic construct]